MKTKHVELNIVSIEVMRHTVVELPATRRYKTGLDWTLLSCGRGQSWQLLASLTKFMLLQKRKRRVNSDRRTTDRKERSSVDDGRLARMARR